MLVPYQRTPDFDLHCACIFPSIRRCKVPSWHSAIKLCSSKFHPCHNCELQDVNHNGQIAQSGANARHSDAVIILCARPANGRRCCNLTWSFVGLRKHKMIPADDIPPFCVTIVNFAMCYFYFQRFTILRSNIWHLRAYVDACVLDYVNLNKLMNKELNCPNIWDTMTLTMPWWRHEMETFSALLTMCEASDAGLWCFLWSVPD